MAPFYPPIVFPFSRLMDARNVPHTQESSYNQQRVEREEEGGHLTPLKERKQERAKEQEVANKTNAFHLLMKTQCKSSSPVLADAFKRYRIDFDTVTNLCNYYDLSFYYSDRKKVPKLSILALSKIGKENNYRFHDVKDFFIRQGMANSELLFKDLTRIESIIFEELDIELSLTSKNWKESESFFNYETLKGSIEIEKSLHKSCNYLLSLVWGGHRPHRSTNFSRLCIRQNKNVCIEHMNIYLDFFISSQACKKLIERIFHIPKEDRLDTSFTLLLSKYIYIGLKGLKFGTYRSQYGNGTYSLDELNCNTLDSIKASLKNILLDEIIFLINDDFRNMLNRIKNSNCESNRRIVPHMSYTAMRNLFQIT